MWHNEPLQMWLLYAQAREQNAADAVDSRAGEMLRRIEAALESAHDQKPRFESRLVVDHSVWQSAVAYPAEVEKAQQLYLRVWERGGHGAGFILDHLADMIALAMQPASISFWQSLLDRKKPRDRGKQRRINTAIAALVLLAIRYKDSAAEAAVIEALHHREPPVRASASYYLVMFYDLLGTEPSEEALAALRQSAVSGKAYEPRYQARLALWFFGRPLPLDNPDGVYVLKVRLRHDRSPRMRRLALRSEQTLLDLHIAIQQAFDWDSDHLYSFYVNGKTGDEAYEIGIREDEFLDDDFLLAFGDQLFASDEQPGPDNVLPMNEQLLKEAESIVEEVLAVELDAEDDEDDGDDEGEWSVHSVRLGDLGFLPKHKFSYLFDFGDHHEFEITVEAIEPRADAGEYPRLLESVGESPPQYDSPDFDDDWDEEE